MSGFAAIVDNFKFFFGGKFFRKYDMINEAKGWGEKLEFRAENSETVKDQIQWVLGAENCKILEVNDENGTTRMTVQKI